jgi:DNA-binding response OmpR family regulator
MELSIRHLDILVVDDHKFTRVILGEILKATECKRVRFCADGAEAFDLIREQAPDIALVDLEMPVDGLDLLRKIRRGARSPDATLPVIMMTSMTDQKRVLAIRNEGATEVIKKPFTAGTVLERIAAVIDHPRAFVKSSAFVGPDRRRAAGIHYAGPRRRASDARSVVEI